MPDSKRFSSFAEFYPFYLREHANRTSRRLHFVGTTIALILLIATLITGSLWLLLVGFLQGYVFAWVGHFFFEHNRPATFIHPFYSFAGDWRLWWEIVTGKIPL